MDYAKKSRKLPRFLYRNLMDSLEAPGASAPAAIAELATSLAALKPREDWLKLKWTMPPRLSARLDEASRAQLEAVLAARRERRNDRFVEVFPHCADEFSLELPFLEAAFGSARVPMIGPRTRTFTLGSCFARNIADFLRNKGYAVTSLQQVEDLNSPFSNAKMLSICAANEEFRRTYVTHWVKALCPPETAARHDEFIAKELSILEAVAQFVRDSEVIIITCGNIIDYFLPSCPLPGEPGPQVAPKFFAVTASENVEMRHYMTQRMREAGADFRMGSYAESIDALLSQHAAIRHLNPRAKVIYTLSPVPIDSALGLQQGGGMGAIEIDCISKSSLRTALGEFFRRLADDGNISYFPSFEIVRWIAPNTGIPLFGNEDAASRHVSQDVLNGVYRYFLHRHGA